jgi:hypothetical protein
LETLNTIEDIIRVINTVKTEERLIIISNSYGGILGQRDLKQSLNYLDRRCLIIKDLEEWKK